MSTSSPGTRPKPRRGGKEMDHTMQPIVELLERSNTNYLGMQINPHNSAMARANTRRGFRLGPISAADVGAVGAEAQEAWERARQQVEQLRVFRQRFGRPPAGVTTTAEQFEYYRGLTQ